MFTKKKLLDILCISLLISFILFISFFNLISDDPGNENFASTLLYILIFIAVTLISYFLRDRVITFFVFGYFVLMTACLVVGIIASSAEADYNAFYLICSMLISPFYGLIYIADICLEISFVISVIMSSVSGILSFKLLKESKNNSRK